MHSRGPKLEAVPLFHGLHLDMVGVSPGAVFFVPLMACHRLCATRIDYRQHSLLRRPCIIGQADFSSIVTTQLVLLGLIRHPHPMNAEVLLQGVLIFNFIVRSPHHVAHLHMLSDLRPLRLYAPGGCSCTS